MPIVFLIPALIAPFAISMAASGPQLALTTAPVPGATVNVTGTGFPPRVKIQLTWDASASGMPTTRTNGAGRAATSFTIPSNTKIGKHDLAALLVATKATSTTADSSTTSGGPKRPRTSPTPTASPAPTASPTPTAPAPLAVLSVDVQAAATPTPTPVPTPTPTPVPTPTPTPVPTPTPTPVPTPTPTPVPTPTPTPVPTPTPTPVPTPTPTPVPTPTPTPVPTPTPTPVPTPTPPAAVTVTSSILTGQQLSGTISWTAIVNAGTASSVEFWIDGSNRWTEFYAPYQFNGDPDGRLVTTTLTNGGHVLTVIARTSSGGSTSATANVTIANGSPTPTPTPTATPTPPPAATPTPLPTATPPAATCGTSLQTLINDTPTGGTLAVPDCLYRESVTVTRPMTIDGTGATIDGRDAAGTPVRQRWLFVSANDVTVRGFTMQYTSGGYAVGGVETATGVQRFVLQGCDVSHAYVNINLTGTTDSTIRNCAIHDATHLGVRVAANAPHGGQRNQISSNRIYHNNRTGEPDPNADAGGLKATWQDGLTLDGNEVYDNGGPGLWLDAACLERHDLEQQGPPQRLGRDHGSRRAPAPRSPATPCGATASADGAVWGWGAGILIASSKDAQVWGNTVAWNYAGISVISQNRSDSPGLTGTYVHDNLVVAEQPTAGNDRYGLFWGQDWSGPLYAAASNNRGATNKFWYPAAENQYARFIWDGYRNLSSFVTVPGGTGSRWLTDAEKSAALAAGGAPASP